MKFLRFKTEYLYFNRNKIMKYDDDDFCVFMFSLNHFRKIHVIIVV